MKKPNIAKKEKIDDTRIPSALFVATAEQILKRTSAGGRMEICVARTTDQFKPHPEMHFHPQPELFLQLSGTSIMQLPAETLYCKSGAAMLIPRGMPHDEKIKATREPFRNLVISFGRRTITVHEARDKGHPAPRIHQVEQFASNDVARLCGYLDDMSLFRMSGEKKNATAIAGLLAAHLTSLLQLINDPGQVRRQESTHIIECRRLVSEHLTNSELNVKWLAVKIKYSADYLSHRFHHETGIPLSEYINQKRITLACELLEKTTLNIAEIALACGYNDPGYMSRQFKQRFGIPPRARRKQGLSRKR